MTDQTPEPVPLGQVTAALENADGTQNIYITRDPAVNALTLTLTNGLSEAIVFPPGKPVAYDELPPGQSAVYIYFNGLVDNTDIANVHLSEIYPAAPPWAAGTFLDSTTRQQYLVIAPAGQVSLGLGQALTFRLASVLVPGPPCSGTADVMLAGTNVTGLASDTGLPIQIVNPPSPGDQPLLVDLDIGFDTPAVYTGQAQSLTLHLVNQKQDAPLVPGGSDAWQGKTPTFQLTLVYGDGAGALTTVGNAGQIGVGIRNAYGNHWHWHRFPGRQGPYWFLQPDLDGGGTVLGTGANASIEFDVTGIESTLPDGLDSALTVAYVNWYDIPGYRPGSMALTITKKAGPQVTLTADPPWVPPGQSGVPTVLTWDAQQATVVRLDAPDVPPGATFPLSGRWPGQGSINVPLDTTLTATAEKYLSSDSTVTGGEAARPGADVITATARLRIGRAPRTDVSAGLGDLGAIVIPARSASAYLFQRQIGRVRPSQLTKAAVLDLSTHAITGTLDLNSLIPAHGGGTLIQDAAPSPDGRTIHVLASSGDAVTGPAPEFYILPLDVASGAYGRPAPLGTLVPASGLPLGAGLLPSADGNVVFVSVADMKSGDMYISALDAATYAAKPSLSWHGRLDQPPYPAILATCNADGSMLLMADWAQLMIINATGGFIEVSTLPIGQQLKLILGPPVISPDATRAYILGIDGLQEPMNASLLAVDIDLGAGTLSLAHNTPLGKVLDDAGPAALSPDARTLYMVVHADTLTAFDTTTFDATQYLFGADRNFTPLLIASGPQQKVLYTTGHDQYTDGTVSILMLP